MEISSLVYKGVIYLSLYVQLLLLSASFVRLISEGVNFLSSTQVEEGGVQPLFELEEELPEVNR